MPILAAILEWLATVALPFIWRNFLVVAFGFVASYIMQRIAATHWGAGVLSSLGGVPIPSALGGTSLDGGGTLASAYALVNQLFPLTETFGFLASFMVFSVACAVYRRTLVAARTATAGQKG